MMLEQQSFNFGSSIQKIKFKDLKFFGNEDNKREGKDEGRLGNGLLLPQEGFIKSIFFAGMLSVLELLDDCRQESNQSSEQGCGVLYATCGGTKLMMEKIESQNSQNTPAYYTGRGLAIDEPQRGGPLRKFSHIILLLSKGFTTFDETALEESHIYSGQNKEGERAGRALIITSDSLLYP
eukprot:scaffold6420_cov78-Cylindrotheca_fusiformis.AAC.3